MDFQPLDNTDGLVLWCDFYVLTCNHSTTTNTTTTTTTTTTPHTHTHTYIYIQVYPSVLNYVPTTDGYSVLFTIPQLLI